MKTNEMKAYSHTNYLHDVEVYKTDEEVLVEMGTTLAEIDAEFRAHEKWRRRINRAQKFVDDGRM